MEFVQAVLVLVLTITFNEGPHLCLSGDMLFLYKTKQYFPDLWMSLDWFEWN